MASKRRAGDLAEGTDRGQLAQMCRDCRLVNQARHRVTLSRAAQTIWAGGRHYQGHSTTARKIAVFTINTLKWAMDLGAPDNWSVLIFPSPLATTPPRTARVYNRKNLHSCAALSDPQPNVLNTHTWFLISFMRWLFSDQRRKEKIILKWIWLLRILSCYISSKKSIALNKVY